MSKAKFYIKEYFRVVGVNLAIFTVILIVWRVLEYVIAGQVSPSIVDSIMGLILGFSVYFNYEQYKEIKRIKNEK